MLKEGYEDIYKECRKKAIESKLITQKGHERDPFVIEREFFKDGIHVKKLKRALL